MISRSVPFGRLIEVPRIAVSETELGSDDCASSSPKLNEMKSLVSAVIAVFVEIAALAFRIVLITSLPLPRGSSSGRK